MNFFEKAALTLRGHTIGHNNSGNSDVGLPSDVSNAKAMAAVDEADTDEDNDADDNTLNDDEDATDTEEDSGIAEESVSDVATPVKKAFPNLGITDTMAEQGTALNNFFNYW